MRRLRGKKMMKRNISVLLLTGIIIVGGMVIRKAVNRSRLSSIEGNL
jgi:hypothetical protein